MYVSVAAGLYSSALVVITPVADPKAGTVRNRTATRAAAATRTPRRNVRIGVSSLPWLMAAETYYQPGRCATGEPWFRASAAVPVPHHGDREQQCRCGDQLAAHDDPVHVDRWAPI